MDVAPGTDLLSLVVEFWFCGVRKSWNSTESIRTEGKLQKCMCSVVEVLKGHSGRNFAMLITHLLQNIFQTDLGLTCRTLNYYS